MNGPQNEQDWKIVVQGVCNDILKPYLAEQVSAGLRAGVKDFLRTTAPNSALALFNNLQGEEIFHLEAKINKLLFASFLTRLRWLFTGQF